MCDQLWHRLPGCTESLSAQELSTMVDNCCVSLQHEKFQSAPGSRVGTPAYLAPEVIMTTKGQTYDGKVSRRLMLWELVPVIDQGCSCLTDL